MIFKKDTKRIYYIFNFESDIMKNKEIRIQQIQIRLDKVAETQNTNNFSRRETRNYKKFACL